jgi:hypothetical protein
MSLNEYFYTKQELKKAGKKYRKDALENVDKYEERKNDPKYKTELCKTFMESNFCSYGNKCRFAHGNSEIFQKSIVPKYKKSNCLSFYTTGSCCYGSRCLFRHSNKNFKLYDRSYYTYLLHVKNFEDYLNNGNRSCKDKVSKVSVERLRVFTNLTENKQLEITPDHNYKEKYPSSRKSSKTYLITDSNSNTSTSVNSKQLSPIGINTIPLKHNKIIGVNLLNKQFNKMQGSRDNLFC